MNPKYCFECYDGYTTGDVEIYATQTEAIEAAADSWHHMTPRERLAYTDRTRGGYFRVVYVEDYDEEADDPLWEAVEIRDWADEMPRGTIPLVIQHRGRIYYLDAPDLPDVDDVWAMVEMYDAIHGTDWWNVLDPSMILGLRLDEFAAAIPIERPEDLEE